MMVRRLDIVPERDAPTAGAPAGSASGGGGGSGLRAIDSWLDVLEKMLRLPGTQRAAIRDELAEHLRERVRDLTLAGIAEGQAVRVALGELGEAGALARRLHKANRWSRRRLLMNASLLGLGAVVVTAGVVTMSPARLALDASIFEDVSRQAPPAALTEHTTDIVLEDTTLREFFEGIGESIDMALLVPWEELEGHGVAVDDPRSIKLKNVTIAQALGAVIELTEGMEQFEWRHHDGMIEIATRETFDEREIVLVSYRIDGILEAVWLRHDLSAEDAKEQITDLLMTMVDPESWRDYGGSLAQMKIVGGRLFIEAPKRMQEKIQWILAELSKDVETLETADAQTGAGAVGDVGRREAGSRRLLGSGMDGGAGSSGIGGVGRREAGSRRLLGSGMDGGAGSSGIGGSGHGGTGGGGGGAGTGR
jgi:hypothetical protein